MITSKTPSRAEKKILTVSQLNSSVSNLLESSFSWIWVEGEISNLAKPASGHIYFSLKDSGAQIRCAMFKSRMRDLKFKPENGLNIVIRGKVTLYEARGDYQIIVDKMEEAGDGLLQRKFEALKEQLSEEGIFAEKIKKEIPTHPKTIGVITSSSGAAIRDVLSVIKRRFPSIPVKIFPVPVQGKEAAPAICNALSSMDNHQSCDVILLVRGGGSLEDLWAFNEETVARAIFNCSIPVVSGVGHEIDFTIADFCADFRAATPTAAAEKVTPDQKTLHHLFSSNGQRLVQLINDKLDSATTHNNHLLKRLEQQHPESVLERLAQRIDDFDQRMRLAWNSFLKHQNNRLLQANTELVASSPLHQIQTTENKIKHRLSQIRLLIDKQLNQKQLEFSNFTTTLNALSPLQTMSRGYSITYNSQGKSISNANNLNVGDKLKTQLHEGEITSIIDNIKE